MPGLPDTLPAPSGPPPPGSRTVRTDDGVPLHVEVDGDPAVPLTVNLTRPQTVDRAFLDLLDRVQGGLREAG